MALQVSLIKAPDDLLGHQVNPSARTFDEQGGTLGRSSANTWPLPDPDRFLSSCHCEIICEQDQFYIVDLSTNGTFVNGSPEPLGKGMRKALAEGDTFEIGDYQFSVSFRADDGALESSPPSGFDDPYPDAPFGKTPEPLGSDFSAPLVGANDDYPVFPSVAENSDPLAVLDQVGNTALDQDPFAPLQPLAHRDPFVTSTTIDQTPSLDQELRWPDSVQQDIIPDDWEDELLNVERESLQPQAVPSVVKPLADRVSQVKDESCQPAEPRHDIAPQPITKGPHAVPESDITLQGRVEPDSKPAPAERHLHARQYDSNDHFITALGLDPDSMAEEDRRAVSEMGGKMLREVVGGLMQLLRSRSTIKNEFRMNVTTIEPFENNPFKFSVGVDEALENIFLKKGKAYKEPLEALQESFQELGEHQLAMIAGVRTGFERMMERFDPQQLETIFKRRGKHSSIPGLRQVRCWTNYCDYYLGFSDNMDSSFQSLFGTDFVQAYEDHLQRLSISRKTSKI